MAKVNLDKIQSKNYGNIESVVATVELHNGALVALNGSLNGVERELKEAVAPSAEAELLLIAAPEVKYNESLDQLDFSTPAGKPVRAYHLTEGDYFQVEQSLFEATPAQGNIVTGSATYGYKVAGGTERTKFVVDELTTFGWDARPMALLRVVSI